MVAQSASKDREPTSLLLPPLPVQSSLSRLKLLLSLCDHSPKSKNRLLLVKVESSLLLHQAEESTGVRSTCSPGLHPGAFVDLEPNSIGDQYGGFGHQIHTTFLVAWCLSRKGRTVICTVKNPSPKYVRISPKLSNTNNQKQKRCVIPFPKAPLAA